MAHYKKVLLKRDENSVNVGYVGKGLKKGLIEDTIETQLTFALFSSEVLGLNLSTYWFSSYHIY